MVLSLKAFGDSFENAFDDPTQTYGVVMVIDTSSSLVAIAPENFFNLELCLCFRPAMAIDLSESTQVASGWCEYVCACVYLLTVDTTETRIDWARISLERKTIEDFSDVSVLKRTLFWWNKKMYFDRFICIYVLDECYLHL